ncbi:MAG: DUF2269 family protein [Actinobacteria bacterium]|nr:DUF2269 family protein [Actinomycetota bacterium]
MIATVTGSTGWAYLLLLTLHILCAIVGFGGVMLNGIWGSALSKARGESAALLAETLHKVSKIAEIFIIAVAVLGIALVLMSNHEHSFASPWLSASMGLYIVALGLSFGLLAPTSRKLVEFARAGNEPTPERAAAEKKVAAISGILHLLLVVILALMVFGPTTTWLLAKAATH